MGWLTDNGQTHRMNRRRGRGAQFPFHGGQFLGQRGVKCSGGGDLRRLHRGLELLGVGAGLGIAVVLGPLLLGAVVALICVLLN